MIKVLTSKQIREADQHTIKHEPIASIDLMERASQSFVNKFLGLHPEKRVVRIFCGTGNNGGDGLAIGRLLQESGWETYTYVIGDSDSGSEDFKTNLNRMNDFLSIRSNKDFPQCSKHDVLIDGLFGSGLSRSMEGLYAELIQYLNGQKSQRIAIDIASGLFADQPVPKGSVVFQPDYTLSFQVPKLAFFQPDNQLYVGEFRILDIGLDEQFISNQATLFHFTESSDVKSLIPIRGKYAHKNQVGRLRIIAGSKGKMGAAVLCARAAFRTGVGLVNVHVPKCGVQIMQIAIPEAMVIEDTGEEGIEGIESGNDVIAIGPGLGTDAKTRRAFSDFIKEAKDPLVIDADAINTLSEDKELLKQLPNETILTPHPGEFKRLVGTWGNDFEKLSLLQKLCKDHQLNVVLKGAYSAVCNSKGEIYFNPTGNPAMATAGSGDVLTGVVASLLAQGLIPFNALLLGVYLHGLAGDEAVLQMQSRWIQASDIVNHLGLATSSLSN